jgi:hypothetical protein
MQYYDQLCYWIREREKIRVLKEANVGKPWSEDWVFQQTYFCNVHREDDRVTRWIRSWSQEAPTDSLEWLMGLARLINKPDTLELWPLDEEPNDQTILYYVNLLKQMASEGTTIWGNAYVVTTHGRKMNKLDYLEEVLIGLLPVREEFKWKNVSTCAKAHYILQGYEGFGSFMAAQVVADLKNTAGHPLFRAEDSFTFVAHGPGSLRGLNWVTGQKITPGNFYTVFDGLHTRIIKDVPELRIDGQDLQNCLCEFDKYCRVREHKGRSKRKYNGNIRCHSR